MIPSSAQAYQSQLHHAMLHGVLSPAAARQYLGAGITLRERTQTPVDVRKFVVEHKPALRKIIEEDSAHQQVSIRAGWDLRRDCYRVTAVCANCERHWSASLTGEMLHRPDWEELVVRDAFAAIADAATGTDCWGAREAALMAEWLTLRLAAAGEQGMPYAQVVHEAVAERYCTPADVDGVLRKMEFVSEWVPLANGGVILPGGWSGEWSLPILYLPVGHPMRTW